MTRPRPRALKLASLLKQLLHNTYIHVDDIVTLLPTAVLAKAFGLYKP